MIANIITAILAIVVWVIGISFMITWTYIMWLGFKELFLQ